MCLHCGSIHPQPIGYPYEGLDFNNPDISGAFYTDDTLHTQQYGHMSNAYASLASTANTTAAQAGSLYGTLGNIDEAGILGLNFDATYTNSRMGALMNGDPSDQSL